VEVRLRDQPGGAVPGAVAPGGGAATRASSIGYGHHLRSRRATGAGDAILGWRRGGGLSPSTQTERDRPGGSPGASGRHPRAAEHGPPEACADRGERQPARVPDALPTRRALVREPAHRRLFAVARIRRAAGAGKWVGPCSALSPAADLREADRVLPDPAPRAPQPAAQGDGSRN